MVTLGTGFGDFKSQRGIARGMVSENRKYRSLFNRFRLTPLPPSVSSENSVLTKVSPIGSVMKTLPSHSIAIAFVIASGAAAR
jgi:hypothetical protein